MRPTHGAWRRDLSRRLSRQLVMRVEEILGQPPTTTGGAQRIGITGPPGAGKSSLIAALASRRLARDRGMAVLAVDPTSPISHGSLLGDRIRMDVVAQDPRLFIRSAPSGACTDGLCRNVVSLLDTLDAAGFDDLVLETVGVGQVSYDARTLVDTFVVVLVPESGDTVQAMKAGSLEMADIYVINKSDLPGSDRIAAELRSTLALSSAKTWEPPIIPVSTRTNSGLENLDAAVDRHFEAVARGRREAARRERRAYELRALLRQHVEEVMADLDPADTGQNLGTLYRDILQRLAALT